MKNWLLITLLLSSQAMAAAEQPAETAPASEPPSGEDDINWVDSSHAYATDSTQALVEWMDEFFGDPLYDAERAESFLRLELINDWDQEDGNDFKVRIRGQVQMPRISNRIHLVFSGDDSNDLDEDEREREDAIGVQYTVNEGSRSRVDLTLSYASSHFKPGIRYRNEGALSDLYSYRFTQRLQYENGENFFSTTLADLNRSLGEDATWRWSNRFVYGERSDGVEWRTRFNIRHRMLEDSPRPLALSYFTAINGVTRPEDFVKNYRVGFLLRRQVYRDFLFVELEPAYNFRRREFEDDREGQWSFVFRLEIALERDLKRIRSRNTQEALPDLP